MALFIQKPIFWNSKHYVSPSGVIGTSGYPQQTGFGHEEWNNSPRMVLTRSGARFRAFHTERVSGDVMANAGQTFVFMTASHDGIQQLVGIAGNALSMAGDQFRAQRQEIAEELSLAELWKEAWAIPNVRQQSQGSLREFRKRWHADVHWIPNWICPDEFFWWLDEPVTLNAQAITGKSKLLTMFGRYTPWDLATASRVFDAIPAELRDEKWTRLYDAMRCAPSEPLPIEEQPSEDEPVTTTLATVNARRGQDVFRARLMQIWKGACAVTSLDIPELLIASHIKPWDGADGWDRLNGHNGLLLSANLDRLFDQGLISFADDGEMLLSSRLSERAPRRAGVATEPLRSAWRARTVSQTPPRRDL
jgi:hypothetical protein